MAELHAMLPGKMRWKNWRKPLKILCYINYWNVAISKEKRSRVGCHYIKRWIFFKETKLKMSPAWLYIQILA